MVNLENAGDDGLFLLIFNLFQVHSLAQHSTRTVETMSEGPCLQNLTSNFIRKGFIYTDIDMEAQITSMELFVIKNDLILE